MPSVREAKKAQTRMAIARAAAEIARNEGIDKLSISNISERAGVSTRTFHNYFNSKEEAILEFTVTSAKQLMGSVGELEALTVFDAVEEAVGKALETSDDELSSLYTLKILSDEVGFLLVGVTNDMDSKLQDELQVIAQECFPEIDPFDLSVQLSAAFATAICAVEYYFYNAHDEGPAGAKKILKRAFDQLRNYHKPLVDMSKHRK